MKLWKKAVVLCALPSFFVACGDDGGNTVPQAEPDPWSIQAWYNVGNLNNQTAAVQLDGQGKPATDSQATLSGSNYQFTPPATWNGHNIPQGTFTPTDYIGAIDPSPTADNWADGWTVGLPDGPNARKAVWGRWTDRATALTVSDCTCPNNVAPTKFSDAINGASLGNDSEGAGLTNAGRIPFRANDEMGVCTLPTRFTDAILQLDNKCIYKIPNSIEAKDGNPAIVGNTRIGQGDDNDPTNDTNSVLRIPAGTLLYGDDKAVLIITRGAKIEANGTPASPIVMTSLTQLKARFDGDPNTDAETGNKEWGGLALMGKAQSNLCGDVFNGCNLEAEGGVGSYGGNDNADNSGNLDYVVARHGGFTLSLNNEINGITFYGTGSGTKVRNVQVHRNFDDGIEFFGGATFARNVVITKVGDECLDWDHGWTGGIQNLLAIQDPNDGNHGVEGDNNETTPETAAPVSFPLIVNATFKGGSTELAAFNLRNGTKFQIWNTIVTGFKNGIDLNNAATFKRAGTNPTVAPTNELIFRNSVVDSTNPFVEQ